MVLFKSPKEFEEAGFEIPMPETLESHPKYLEATKSLAMWCKRLPGLHTPRYEDGTGGSPPRPHQIRHVGIAAMRRHNFLGWTMGVGKTLTSILYILLIYGDRLFNEFDFETFLKATPERKQFMLQRARRACQVRPGTIHIVGPRHILDLVWMTELKRLQLDGFAEIIESESQLRNSRAPIFIYDVDFPKLQSDLGKHQRKAGEGLRIKQNGRTYFKGHEMGKIIKKYRPPSLLVVDEIHKLKEQTTRTESMKLIRRKAKRVLALSGTPMDGRIAHLSTIYGFVYGESSKLYPYTNSHFTEKFTIKKIVKTDVMTGEETVGKERPVPGVHTMQIPAFIRSTQHLSHRLNITDPEVKSNVPYPITNDVVITVDMDSKHLEFYHSQFKRAEQDAALDASIGLFRQRLNALAIINNLRLSSKVPHQLGYEGETPQLVKKLIEIVKKHSAEGRKGLIGTTFIEESRIIHEQLQAAGLKGVRLYATDEKAKPKKLTAENREELIEQFMENEEMQYLICNKELVAEGLNLAEFASYTVSCSHGWRSNVEAQWLARVVRPGQLWPVVDCYTLINRGTIDRYIFELIQAKLKANAGMIDLDLDYGESSESLTIDPLSVLKNLNQTQDKELQLDVCC